MRITNVEMPKILFISIPSFSHTLIPAFLEFVVGKREILVHLKRIHELSLTSFCLNESYIAPTMRITNVELSRFHYVNTSRV